MIRLRSLPPNGWDQRAGPSHVFLRDDEQGFRYLPCAGTYGYDDPFAMDPSSPFQRTLAREKFYPILDDRQMPFNVQTALDGIVGRHEIWITMANCLYWFLQNTPYVDRNLIVSSHFGQPAWLLAKSGFELRSVTFVGTPVRFDVGAEQGIKKIDMPQVIYDKGVDLMGWLGSWFSGNITGDRTFKHLGPKMKRYGYDNIGHIRVLTDASLVSMWHNEPWLDNIRRAALTSSQD